MVGGDLLRTGGAKGSISETWTLAMSAQCFRERMSPREASDWVVLTDPSGGQAAKTPWDGEAVAG